MGINECKEMELLSSEEMHKEFFPRNVYKVLKLKGAIQMSLDRELKLEGVIPWYLALVMKSNI